MTCLTFTWSFTIFTGFTDKSEKAYKKYMERLQNADAETDVEMNSEVSDTVGAIALDKFGNAASTVSSGGNWLKHSGRIGHVSDFACKTRIITFLYTAISYYCWFVSGTGIRVRMLGVKR